MLISTNLNSPHLVYKVRCQHRPSYGSSYPEAGFCQISNQDIINDYTVLPGKTIPFQTIFQHCYLEGCNKSTYFRCIIHKKFNNIQKAHTISAHLQFPRVTKTTQTEILEFCEMGENNEPSSQVLMRAVLAGNGQKYGKNPRVIALILHLELKLFELDMQQNTCALT